MKKLPISAAIKAASRSTHPQYWHSALLIRGGAVLASGWNHDGRHAEIVALGKLWPSKRVGATLVSLRVGRDGKLAMAKPCPECAKVLREAGIMKIYYSDRNGNVVLDRELE